MCECMSTISTAAAGADDDAIVWCCPKCVVAGGTHLPGCDVRARR